MHTNEEIIERLDKMSFHIKLLVETLDGEKDLWSIVIVENDWGRDDMQTAYDIFSDYQTMLEKSEPVSAYQFEKRFLDELKIDHQILKGVVRGLKQDCRFVDVCDWYIKHSNA